MGSDVAQFPPKIAADPSTKFGAIFETDPPIFVAGVRGRKFLFAALRADLEDRRCAGHS